MARTRWPSDLGTPASCPGQADQTGSAGGCQRNLGPADRSFPKTTSGVSRLAGQAGTQATDPTPKPIQNRGSRAGALIHILPAEYLRYHEDQPDWLRCSDYPVLGFPVSLAAVGWIVR